MSGKKYREKQRTKNIKKKERQLKDIIAHIKALGLDNMSDALIKKLMKK